MAYTCRRSYGCLAEPAIQPVKPHDDYYGQYKANTGIINNNNEGKKLNNICLGARSNRTDNSD